MIRLTNVQGDVLVDDRKKDDRMMARDGLTLDPAGDYLVATTQSSSADVQAYGKLIRLGTFSYLRVAGIRNVEGKHSEYWTAKTTRVFLARVWALAGGR
jgi:hypothetical protein